MKYPQHFRFIIPIIDVLKELGGSGKPAEVSDKVIETVDLSEEELSQTIKSGASRVVNQIHWAKLLLVKAGYMDSSKRGVWTLVEKGQKADTTDELLKELYSFRKEWHKRYREQRLQEKRDEAEKAIDEETEEQQPVVVSYREELQSILLNMSPAGFERICQRLLRESGFEQVTVTGKSGDGGIDGIGTLQVNPFVSFKVLFQCKRYQGPVSSSQVRDFKGALLGRADKGIILTTGYFTRDAKAEARRDGAPPIEIIDGEKLLDMFESLELGLLPVTTYEVDAKFFEEFLD